MRGLYFVVFAFFVQNLIRLHCGRYVACLYFVFVQRSYNVINVRIFVLNSLAHPYFIILINCFSSIEGIACSSLFFLCRYLAESSYLIMNRLAMMTMTTCNSQSWQWLALDVMTNRMSRLCTSHVDEMIELPSSYFSLRKARCG